MASAVMVMAVAMAALVSIAAARAQPLEPPAPPPSSSHSLTIDAWDYFVGRQNQSFCVAGAGSLCLSNSETAPGTQIDNRTDSLIVVTAKAAGGRIKVVKDGASGPGRAWLRCFGSAPGDCSGNVQAWPQKVALPILPASAIVASRWTPGGYLMPPAAGFYGTAVDPLSCAVLPASAGFYATGAGQMFLVDSYDFGGVIGVKRYVLVTEAVATGGHSPDPTKGMRLERYFFVPGYGHLREEGWEDAACIKGTSAADCTGNYSGSAPGATTFSSSPGTKLAPFEYCAPGATGARIVAQSIPAAMVGGGSYEASVTIENTGGTVWTAAAGIELRLQNPADSLSWRPGRVQLSPGEKVSPGETKRFAITLTAPQTSGTFRLRWRMVREGEHWFGDSSDAAVIVQPASRDDAGVSRPVGRLADGGPYGR